MQEYGTAMVGNHMYTFIYVTHSYFVSKCPAHLDDLLHSSQFIGIWDTVPRSILLYQWKPLQKNPSYALMQRYSGIKGIKFAWKCKHFMISVIMQVMH